MNYWNVWGAYIFFLKKYALFSYIACPMLQTVIYRCLISVWEAEHKSCHVSLRCVRSGVQCPPSHLFLSTVTLVTAITTLYTHFSLVIH